MNDMTRIAGSAAGVPAGHWAKAAEERAGPNWLRWAGPILSVGVIIAVVNALGARDLIQLWRHLPRTPGFWVLLCLLLAAQPIADFVIFRGLWRLPAAGLVALFRKTATNELVLGYSGELQFYLWARRHAQIPGSPFGAVRDVAVLSALVGNVVTIVLLATTLPMLGKAWINPLGPHLILAAIGLVGSSLVVMLFRRRLFALTRDQIWRIAAIHLARAVVVTLLLGATWHYLQPEIAFGWWVILAAARQFITRLPFLPNKDLVFAGLAAGILSGDPDLTLTIALVATLFAAGQVLIGGTLAVVDLAREASATRRPA